LDYSLRIGVIVGFGFSGAFGAAVLYKKKDDESLVIIKEINMLDLKKTERALAMNEVRCFVHANTHMLCTGV